MTPDPPTMTDNLPSTEPLRWEDPGRPPDWSWRLTNWLRTRRTERGAEKDPFILMRCAFQDGLDNGLTHGQLRRQLTGRRGRLPSRLHKTPAQNREEPVGFVRWCPRSRR
jgi:hypothetical protein